MAFESISELAAELDMPPMFVAAVVASGMSERTVGIYGPHVASLAQVGKHFGVSERTAASWIAAGAPSKTDQGYSLPHLEFWRWLERPESDHEPGGAAHGQPDLPERLVMGLLRTIRHETMQALEEFAERVDDPTAPQKLRDFIEEKLQDSLILNEDDLRAVAASVDHGASFK